MLHTLQLFRQMASVSVLWFLQYSEEIKTMVLFSNNIGNCTKKGHPVYLVQQLRPSLTEVFIHCFSLWSSSYYVDIQCETSGNSIHTIFCQASLLQVHAVQTITWPLDTRLPSRPGQSLHQAGFSNSVTRIGNGQKKAGHTFLHTPLSFQKGNQS